MEAKTKSSDFSILHTSDLHLSENKPETLKALDEILKFAKKKQVSLITIGGDIFNSPIDAEKLRPIIREKFSGNEFDIIAIPGNHDADVFQSNLDFGSDIKVFTKEPFEVFTEKKYSIIAIPYTQSLSDEMLIALQEAGKQSDINMLLIHCTLDIGYTHFDFGDEELNYCPISKSKLSKLNYDFILAGHFHSSTNIQHLASGGKFIYPGSPVSITRKELGKRKIILLDLDNKKCKSFPLSSFYYDKCEVNILPGQEEEKLSFIGNWIKKRYKDNCSLDVIINGFIKQSEKKFSKCLEVLCEKNVSIKNDCKTVKRILDHPLFKRFKEKIREREHSNQITIEEIVIKAMSELIAAGELRS